MTGEDQGKGKIPWWIRVVEAVLMAAIISIVMWLTLDIPFIQEACCKREEATMSLIKFNNSEDIQAQPTTCQTDLEQAQMKLEKICKVFPSL
jgi:hypothetical protein